MDFVIIFQWHLLIRNSFNNIILNNCTLHTCALQCYITSHKRFHNVNVRILSSEWNKTYQKQISVKY